MIYQVLTVKYYSVQCYLTSQKGILSFYYVCCITNRSSINYRPFDKIDLFYTALQSLDSLNEQILQFIFSSSLASNTGSGGVVSGLISSFDNDALLPKQRDALTASLTLMRRLLMDAQVRNPYFFSRNSEFILLVQ